ncbi:MAG: CDP-diacylglycerol--serine O-phosphatidyltransferase [Gammaproteobacteria bacterium]
MRIVHSHSNEPPGRKAPRVESRRRAGIYLLPNLFTTGALFAGFYGIVAAINTRFEAAAIAIVVAMVLDGMDGRIARMTNTQSDFGAQYDSLSDMVSFGLAPALVIYEWALVDLGKIGWLAAFVYTAGAALRLARFNTQVGIADKRYFQGLPSPAAAAIVASLVWVGDHFALRGSTVLALVATGVTVLAALLMVSNVRYYSFKDFDLRGRVPFVTVLAVVMVFVLISIEPASVLLVLFGGYALSGIADTWWQRRRRRAERREAKAASGAEE